MMYNLVRFTPPSQLQGRRPKKTKSTATTSSSATSLLWSQDESFFSMHKKKKKQHQKAYYHRLQSPTFAPLFLQPADSTAATVATSTVGTIPSLLSEIEPSITASSSGWDNTEEQLFVAASWKTGSQDSVDHSMASTTNDVLRMCAQSTNHCFVWNIFVVHHSETLFEFISVPLMRASVTVGEILRSLATYSTASCLQRQTYTGLCNLSVHSTAPWTQMEALFGAITESNNILLAIPEGWLPSDVRRLYRHLCHEYDIPRNLSSSDRATSVLFEI